MSALDRKRSWGVLIAVALLLGLLPAVAVAQNEANGDELPFVEVVSNPRTECLPGDRPEPGLQGGTPGSERQPPLGFQGFNCAVDKVGQHTLNDRGSLGSTTFVNYGDHGHCNYTSMRTPSNLNHPDTGTMVLDLAVPSQPQLVDILRTPAMLRAYSALYIEQGIMIGAFQNSVAFDVYDVSDCLNPSFLSTIVQPAGNHDGWLTRDATTYYGVPFEGGSVLENPDVIDIHVTDLSDPYNPEVILEWNRIDGLEHGGMPQEVFDVVAPTRNFHDASTNEDGTRLYLALYGGVQPLGGGPGEAGRCGNGLMILDSSEIAEGRLDPQLHFISFLSWCDQPDPEYLDGATAAAHSTRYGIHQNGKEYIIATDEQFALTGSPTNVCNQRSYARMIDISDETRPFVVSKWNPEANRPHNCQTLHDENYIAGMTHYFDVDDRYNFRYVFYAASNQGVRVVDYLDPENPREVGYYNAPRHPELTPLTGTDFTRPDVPYDQNNCFLHSGWNQNGLILLEITDPEHNPCMRKTASGAGWFADGNGGKVHVTLNAARADLESINGRVKLFGTPKGGPRASTTPDIDIDVLTFLGSVRDECGPVPSTANALQFEGTGTYNGEDASFRVCVMDNGQGASSAADRIHVACTNGCNYSVSGELAAGNLQVRGERGERFEAPAPLRDALPPADPPNSGD